MTYSIDLVNQGATPTLSVRRHSRVDQLPAVLGEAYSEIIHFAGTLGVETLGPAFTIYYNMNMEDLDLEIGFVAKEKIPGNETIQSSEIPAGRYVSAVFAGPYAEMPKMYSEMSTFMIEQGLIPSGTACEFYYNSPMDVPETELRTQVLLGTYLN